MDIDLESLYQTVDQLDPQQRAKLLTYLTSGQRDAQPQHNTAEWQFDLAPGAIQTTPDFDDPLPDEFWLGEA
jgi:hypothetical protein